MYSDSDMEDEDIGYSPSSISNYKLLLDEDRFEEQYLGGQRGYYDKIEKVFVSVNAFDVLFAEDGYRGRQMISLALKPML